MPKLNHRPPSYRRHKASGQAVVTIGGRDIYLGRYNSPASRFEYNRLIAEWAVHGGNFPQAHASDLTVAEIAGAFWRHAMGYYRYFDGRPTGELSSYKTLLARLNKLYGRTRAADFGPLALKTI